MSSPLCVAIQGEHGAFSHQAALQLFGADVEILPCRDFPGLFQAVAEGRAERGAVPMENSLAGAVVENLDLMAAASVHAVAETRVRVELCLVAPPGLRLDELNRVASHPVALRQCRAFFGAHPSIVEVPAYDTAGSVRDLIGGGADYDAAIGSALAAELYGGEILVRGLEDDPLNHTRFLGVAPGIAPPLGAARKASLTFTLPHRPGSLHAVLGVLAERDVDLLWIMSRPIAGKPWEYRFHVDVHSDDPTALRSAYEVLGASVGDVKLLGAYA